MQIEFNMVHNIRTKLTYILSSSGCLCICLSITVNITSIFNIKKSLCIQNIIRVSVDSLCRDGTNTQIIHTMAVTLKQVLPLSQHKVPLIICVFITVYYNAMPSYSRHPAAAVCCVGHHFVHIVFFRDHRLLTAFGLGTRLHSARFLQTLESSFF